MQVQPAITDSRPLVNPEGGSFPWPMQFPEDSFDPVSQASVVPPAAIEVSFGARGQNARQNLANDCGVNCRIHEILGEKQVLQRMRKATMTGRGIDRIKIS